MIVHVESNTNTQSTMFTKSTMLKSSLCDYSDAYILAKETITIVNTGAAANPNNHNEKIIFKN